MDCHMSTEFLVDALRIAVRKRKPAAGLLHHSDQAVHYASLSSSRRLREVGLQPSVGRTGSALDNAMVASFVSTFKAELVSRMSFPSQQGRQECHLRVSGAFYNTRWLHSALGHRSPAVSEAGRMGDAKVA
jgi:transposase InsO family protein